MKAAVVTQFGSPDCLQVEDVAMPSPKADEVLIKVQSAGVNPVDTYLRGGAQVFKENPKPPYVCGSDGAGVIEGVGSAVSRFTVGDRVWFSSPAHLSGSYAEYIALPAKWAAPLSDKLTFNQGATIGIPYLTAHRALFIYGHASAGSKVLIHGGSGAVGLACIELATASGCEVYATAGTEQGLGLLKFKGAKHVYNHKDAGYTDQILKDTNGAGLNVVVEMLANVNLDRDAELLAFRGRIMVVGSRGTVEINPFNLMSREAYVIGILTLLQSDEELADGEKAIKTGADRGFISPLIKKAYKLDEAGAAHRDVIEQPGGAAGNLVINP